MIHLVILAVHLLSTIAKLVRPGGVRTVVAESLVLKQQLLISSRSRRRAIHRGHTMKKMGARSLADLVRMAEVLGIRRARS